MAEEEVQSTEPKESKPSSQKKLLKWGIIGGILLLFLGIEIGVAVFFVNQLKPQDETLQSLQAEQEEGSRILQQQTEMGATLAAPIEVTVNIHGTNGERFLKCGVQLEFDPTYELLANELELRKPKIKNIIIDILSSRSLSDLMTVEGKKSIRDAIVADVNASLPTSVEGQEVGKVRRSFFDSFIIQ